MATQPNSIPLTPSTEATQSSATNPKKRKLDTDFGEEIVLLSFQTHLKGRVLQRYRLHKSIAYKIIPYCVAGNKANTTEYVGDEEVFNIYTDHYSPSVGQQLMNWVYYQEMDDIGGKIKIGNAVKLFKLAGELRMNDLQTTLQENLANYCSRYPDQTCSILDRCSGIPLEKVLFKVMVEKLPIAEIRRLIRQSNKDVVVQLAGAFLDKEEERRIALGIKEGDASGSNVAE